MAKQKTQCVKKGKIKAVGGRTVRRGPGKTKQSKAKVSQQCSRTKAFKTKATFVMTLTMQRIVLMERARMTRTQSIISLVAAALLMMTTV